MLEKENPIDPNWAFDNIYYLNGTIYGLFAIIALSLLDFFTSPSQEYKIIEVILIVICSILIPINYKLNFTFLHQNEKFNYSFNQTGLLVNQAEKTGLMFVKPKQIQTNILYADIEKVYIWESFLNWRRRSYRYIYIKLKNQPSASLLSKLPQYFHFLSPRLPGIWNGYLRIPAVTKENANIFTEKLIKVGNISPSQITELRSAIPQFLKLYTVNLVITFTIILTIILFVSWKSFLLIFFGIII